MKRMILAVLVSLSATLASAQDAGDYDATARAAIEAQDKANNDLINGARMRIESGNRADVIAGLEALQNHLSIGEKALDKQELTACSTMAMGGLRPPIKPCNPYPALKRALEKDFNQRNWPVAASPSAAFGWMVDQYNIGPENTKKEIVNYASMISWDIAGMRILPAVELMNSITLQETTIETHRQIVQDKRDHDATIVGNFSSMHERILPAFWNWIGMFFAVALLSGFLTSPLANYILFFLSPSTRKKLGDKLVGNINYIMIAYIPVQALYVLFGGILERYAKGSFSMLIFLAVFIPLVVLVKRVWPNASIIPAFVFKMFKGGSSRTVQKVAGDAIHGSAQWSTAVTAADNGRLFKNGRVMSDSYGFVMGRVTEDVPADLDVDTRVRYMGHVTTLAPSGSGKGIGAVTPTLLEYPGSTIVLDPKGELYATTARYRRDVLGHKIIACDPFGVLKGLGYEDATYRLNWIDYIEPDSEDVTSQASLLADLLVLSEGNANESSVHFLETARTFLRGLLVHVATLENSTKRNMGEVRRLLTCSEAEFKDLMIDMKLNKRGAELPVRAANSLLATPEKERGSILSTARRNLDFIDDQRIVRALEQSDFDLKKLKQEKMTVYVIMPPDRIETNKRYLRVMFGLAVHGVTKVAGKPDYRVLFLLDEFAQLGRMTVIENALPIIRGYGGVFWFILQNISQLKTNYPNNWESFIANSGAKQFFGTADYETAKYISDTLGKTTVEYQTNSSNSGSSFGQGMSVNSGDGTSQQFTGRDLMTADEVLKLPADQVIVMLSGKGEAPYLLNRITYYRDAEYAGRFDPNPYEN